MVGTVPEFSIYITLLAADCSISQKFGTEIDHITADLLQVFKVKRSPSEVKITWISARKSPKYAYCIGNRSRRIQSGWGNVELVHGPGK